MAEYERTTTYNDDGAVLYGAAAVWVSPYQATPSWTSIGAVVDVSVQRNIQTTEEQVDDGPGKQRIFKQDATLKFIGLEYLNTTVREIMMGDTDTFTTNAGAPVAANVQTIAANWTDQMWYPLDGQQASGAQPTMTSVIGSVTGALAADAAGIDDYTISKNSAGIWGIQFNTNGLAGAVTTESIAITTAYTPSASVDVDWGAGTALSQFIVKFEASNQSGRAVTQTYWLCYVESIDAVTWMADDAEDSRFKPPLTITAKPDGTYHSFNVGRENIIT